MKKYKLGDLRVWWIPQLGIQGRFFWPVKTIAEGVNLLNLLADYDKFQFVKRVKPDYCNAGGIESFAKGVWEDWYDEETGEENPHEFCAIENKALDAT